jgi:hypothetical protein
VSRLESEVAEQAARAFRRRRWAKSRPERGAWKGEAVTAVITGVIGYIVAGPAKQPVLSVVSTVGAALSGIVVWHFLLHRLYRYVSVVPVEEHVAQAIRIYELETEAREAHSARVAAATATVATLTTFHKEGVGIRDRIRRIGWRWDNELENQAKGWEARVRLALQKTAPHLVPRFDSDTGRTRHPKTLENLGDRALIWADLMDCRLGNLQTVIEIIAGRSQEGGS